jgi:hypothetical protein
LGREGWEGVHDGWLWCCSGGDVGGGGGCSDVFDVVDVVDVDVDRLSRLLREAADESLRTESRGDVVLHVHMRTRLDGYWFVYW